MSPGAQTDSEREHVIQALIVWVKSLSEDVVKSVRKDDHVRAYQNLDEFLRGMDVLRTVGRAKDVKKEYDWVKHNMKSAKRRLEAEPSAISLLLRIKKM